MELHILKIWKKMETWGDHQKKKLFIDNSVQVLILFKEGHQGLLKMNAPLGAGVLRLGKKRKEFSSRWKKNVWGGHSESIEILFVLSPSK